MYLRIKNRNMRCKEMWEMESYNGIKPVSDVISRSR